MATYYSKQLPLDDVKPTPFTILFALYNARLALSVPGFATLAIAQQCASLSNDRINAKAPRRSLVATFTNSDAADFSSLSHRVCLRIRVKHILRRFYVETQRLRHSTDVSSWTSHEILLSFISHLIEASASDDSANKKNTAHEKIWEFVNYLRRYFDEQSYDGRRFLAAFAGKNNGDAKAKTTKGFGLQMMKTVCAEYKLKSGPFSKVKKQCNVWATNVHKQSQRSPHERHEIAAAAPQKQKEAQILYPSQQKVKVKVNPLKKPLDNSRASKFLLPIQNNEEPYDAPLSYDATYNKFVTDVSMYANPHAQPQNAHANVLSGKQWFWFNDVGGFKWVPYREADMAKLNSAWREGHKSCLIINGEYRVEFDRSNAAKPQGNQYNSRMSSPGGRTVVCSKPAKMIHGIPVADQPM